MQNSLEKLSFGNKIVGSKILGYYPKFVILGVMFTLRSYLSEPWTGRLVQVVECLPSKHKALSSSSSTEKKKLFV
jgi:hypothetical protein